MNIRFLGEAPALAGTVFTVREGAVGSADPSGAEWPVAGLSSGIVREFGEPVPATATERGIEVDQTNRSVIVDERWIVKHIVTWGTSNRASAIEQALAAAGSEDVPGFVGALEWDHPELGLATIALVNRYESLASDGWAWAPDDLIALVAASGSDAPQPNDPAWPRELGALVARVHIALDAAQLPLGERIGVTVDSARQLAAETRDRLAGRTDPAAVRFRARFGEIDAALRSLPGDWRPAWGVPHGDLHVGQVIRTGAGRYLLLDFDGDPQWTQGSGFRREPLERDIAHMLNSIDLVAAVAQKRLGRVVAEAWSWADRARDSFLQSYVAALRAASSTLEIDQRALPALAAEQLMLEWRYADQFLPEWEYAPDAVLTHRYRPDPHVFQEDPPWIPPSSSQTSNKSRRG